MTNKIEALHKLTNKKEKKKYSFLIQMIYDNTINHIQNNKNQKKRNKIKERIYSQKIDLLFKIKIYYLNLKIGK